MRIRKFQKEVRKWFDAAFGHNAAMDLVERNHRFLEESLELVQSTGCTQAEACQLIDYVYGRPIGGAEQEVGGVMMTLFALCNAQGMDVENCADDELIKSWDKIETIRAEQAAKPKHTPLPQ